MNQANSKKQILILATEFINRLIPHGVCPYCSEPVELGPVSPCCGEVHGELGWHDPETGYYFLAGDLNDELHEWLKTQIKEN